MTRPSHPFLAGPRPRAFAHRGWHTGDLRGLENSLAAFERAEAEGYSYVETDVHATADDVLVVQHDATLRRVADHPGVVRRMTWAEIADLRVGGREPVRRLEEVLEALPGMRFNVDLKAGGAVAPMLGLLERDEVAARVAVASMEETRVQAVRDRFGPQVVTGVAARSVLALRGRSVTPRPLRSMLGRFWPVRGDLAQLPVRLGALSLVDAATVRAAHDLGVEVHVWTVDRPAEMHRLLDLGVDGLMTDRPDVLRDVLRARGRWTGADGGSGVDRGPRG